MRTIALALAVLFVAGTGLSLLRFTDWWVRAWDFPRPQIAIVGTLLLIAYLLVWNVRERREQLLLVLLAASVLYQLVRILPYTPLYPVEVTRAAQVDENNALAVLISNVFMENREAERLIDLVRRQAPDVLLVVEADDWWEQQLRELEADLPHTLKHPLPNTYGMLLYSRLPLEQAEVEFLIDDEIPSMHADLRLPSGRRVRFHGLHPRPPSPTEASDSVERDGELLMVARRVSEYGGPSLVVGDLNDVAWSATTSLMQRVGGMLDPRIGRGLYSTFHAKIPLLRWPLDHAFHTDHFQLVELRRLPAIGSDHFPVYIRLVLTPDAHEEQEAPDLEAGDLTRAREKIEEAKEAEEAEGTEEPNP